MALLCLQVQGLTTISNSINFSLENLLPAAPLKQCQALQAAWKTGINQ